MAYTLKHLEIAQLAEKLDATVFSTPEATFISKEDTQIIVHTEQFLNETDYEVFGITVIQPDEVSGGKETFTVMLDSRNDAKSVVNTVRKAL